MATPPDFVAGQVLTAAQMNAVGLWLVKTQTIGTTVSSVTVTDAFSADYQHYKIMLAGGVASTTNTLRITLGATTAGYYQGGYGTTFAAVAAAANVNNGAFWVLGTGSTNSLYTNFDLLNPNETNETMMQGFIPDSQTGGGSYSVGGFLNNATSYTDFTITASTGTLTGGIVYVYGYRK